jgi:hypothetical protein
MVPGFSHKRGVAYPSLVLVTFVLGNLAAFLRVAPLFFADSELALRLWGISGLVGWLAVAALAVNLFVTLRRGPSQTESLLPDPSSYKLREKTSG